MEIISVKEKLAAGEPSIGTWSSSGDPTVVEVLARTGLDWINLDFEHNPIDVSTAIHCLRAMGGTGKAPFARIPWNDPVWIKRVLDIGFLGVVVPDVKSPDDARRAVAAARYRPEGVRGIGSARGMLVYGDDYYDKANDMVTVVCMIEDVEAVAKIDDILAVPGVDVAFIGPNDLANTLGVPVGNDNQAPRPCCGGTAGGGCGQAGRSADRDPLRRRRRGGETNRTGDAVDANSLRRARPEVGDSTSRSPRSKAAASGRSGDDSGTFY